MGIKFTGTAAMVCLGALLSGCQTGVPQAENLPTKEQLILKSAGQWQVLANWTVAQLAPSLPVSKRLQVQADGDSLFSTSFAEFLSTALVQRGYIVGGDDTAPVLHFDVEVVAHGHTPPPQPLAFTFLGALGGMTTWILDTNGIQPAAAGLAAAFAAGPTVDVVRGYFPAPTDTEVAVTTSLSQSKQRYASKSDVFYISRSDKDEYETPGQTQENTLASDVFP